MSLLAWLVLLKTRVQSTVAPRVAHAAVHRRPARPARARRGFTLVEILVATALVLLLMAIVVQIFADVGKNIRNSRSALEKNDELRSAVHRLRKDLEGVTCSMRPPVSPDSNQGYFEVEEGPMGPVYSPMMVSQYNPGPGLVNDNTPGDFDDKLMFTTRSKTEPFAGRFSSRRFPITTSTPPETPDGNDGIGDYKWQAATMQSDTAEVAWFIRGTTLYRRVLLVRPDRLMDCDVRNNTATATPLDPLPSMSGFYGFYDLSVRAVRGFYDRDPGQTLVATQIIPNTLADLTKRENRFGHQPFVYPHDARGWGALGMPTLRECSDPKWPFPFAAPIGAASGSGSSGESLFQRHDSDVYGATDQRSKYILPRSSGGANRHFLVEEGTSGNNAYFGYQPCTQLQVSGSVPAHWADFVALTPRSAVDYYDAWRTPYPWLQTDRITGNLLEYPDGQRIAEDIILTNVLGFDVKVWDPYAPIMAESASGAVIMPGDPGYIAALNGFGSTHAAIGNGAYVDLNYMCQLQDNLDNTGASNPDGLPDVPGATTDATMARAALSLFRGAGGPYPFNDITLSGLRGCPPGMAIPIASVWDTSSTHYERDGVNQDLDGAVDEYTDGYDNAAVNNTTQVTNNLATGLNTNGIDDPTEQEAPPPYAARLSGVQIKVRVFDPESQQIREVTLTHSFQER